MAAIITWTPRNGAILVTLDLGDLAYGLETRGFIRTTGTMSVSVGRKEKVTALDSAFMFDLRLTGIDHDANPATDDYPFETLTSFLSHAEAGGTFSFARDSTKNYATTLAVALSAVTGTSTTNVDVATTTGFAVGDIVYLEHVTDKTRWEVHRISALSTDFNLGTPATIDYPIGSIFRHWEYLPSCSATGIVFEERQAGRGVGLWDLKMVIESTRG